MKTLPTLVLNAGCRSGCRFAQTSPGFGLLGFINALFGYPLKTLIMNPSSLILVTPTPVKLRNHSCLWVSVTSPIRSYDIII